MAYDNQSFIQKLRQNQILRPEGQGLPNPYIGMPNFMTGRQQELQQENGGGGTSVRLPQNSSGAPGYSINPPIDNSVRMQVPGPRDNMASAWIPGAADINAGRMVMGQTPAQEHERAMDLQGARLGVQYGNLGIKSRAQDLKELIQSGRATDAEKQEYAMAQIGARGDIGSRQIGERGTIQKDVAGINNTAAMERLGKSITSNEGIAGANRLSRESIASGDRTSREGIAAGSRNTEPNAGQLSIQEESAARRLANTNPELGRFIVMQPNGSFAIGADEDGNQPTPDQLKIMSSAIYGSTPQQDIELPEKNYRPGLPTRQQPARSATTPMMQNTTPGSTTPTSRTPNASANDPLGIR